jgi:transcriptional regulator with XRE-family HTH domain
MARFAFDGSELKRRRREAGLTQAELARLVGRSHASVTHYEIGISVPPVQVLLELSSTLGVEPGALFSPEPERERAMS